MTVCNIHLQLSKFSLIERVTEIVTPPGFRVSHSLVLRHRQSTTRHEIFCTQSCRRVRVQNTCLSPHLQLFGASGTSVTIISKYWASKQKLFILHRIFRRNTVGIWI